MRRRLAMFGAGFLCLLLSSSEDRAGWSIIPSGTTKQFNTAFVPDGSFIALGDSGVVLKRIYPDTNFVVQTIPGAGSLWGLGENYVGIYWICGARGRVYNTTDQGRDWQPFPVADSGVTLRACIANGGYQWCFGDSGLIFESMNSGTNWNSEASGTHRRLNYSIISAVVVGDSGTILRSTDLGANWLNAPSGTTHRLNAVTQGGNLLAVGDAGTILRSTNLGVSWDTANSGTTVNLYGCSEYADIGLACGANGTILKSTDGGVTWGKQSSPTTQALHGIVAMNGLQFIAVGANGTLVVTNDGGGSVTSVGPAPLQQPSGLQLEQNYPNPFNPATVIRFALPSRMNATLVVYDLLGRRIATLAEGELEAGAHELRFDGSNLASGVYYYQLRARGNVLTRKLYLLR